MIAAGFDRYDGEKRPSRGLTSLGLDDDDDARRRHRLLDRAATTTRDGDDEFDVPEFLR